MDNEAYYPLPQPTAFTTRFWEACQRQELEIPQCQSCNHLFLPGGPVCPNCWSQELDSCLASGRGKVANYVVYHRSYHRAIHAPYVVAIIELEEGVRMVSNVILCPPESISIGMPVQVVFEKAANAESDFLLPKFKPVGED